MLVSQPKLVHVAHDSAVKHPSLSKVAHSEYALQVNAGYKVVYHLKVHELQGAAVDPLSPFLAVPGNEVAEDGRLWHPRVAVPAFHGHIDWEDPKAKPAERMHGVVVELPEGNPLRADVRVERRAVWMLVHAVPEAEVGTSRRRVVADGVVGIGDPEGCGSDVIVQQAGALFDKHGQVMLQDVPRLYAILHEESPAHDVIDDIVLHQQPMSVVDVHGPVERPVDGTASHERLVVEVSQAMPVDGITSQPKGLSNVEQLQQRDFQLTISMCVTPQTHEEGTSSRDQTRGFS